VEEAVAAAKEMHHGAYGTHPPPLLHSVI
jgi:hypothetical protein